MKNRILNYLKLLFIFAILIWNQQLTAQLNAVSDTYSFRSDTGAQYILRVTANDNLPYPSRTKITSIMKDPILGGNFKVDTAAGGLSIIFTDTISTIYSSFFTYFIQDTTPGGLDSAVVWINKVAVTNFINIGDVNQDSLSNHLDLFGIGMNFNKIGNPRHLFDMIQGNKPLPSIPWANQSGINGSASDLNGDGIVDNLDLNLLISSLGKSFGTYRPKLSGTSSTNLLTSSLLSSASQDTIFINSPSDTIHAIGIRPQVPQTVPSYGLAFSIHPMISSAQDTTKRYHPNYKYARTQNPWSSSSSSVLFVQDTVSRKSFSNMAYARSDHGNGGIGSDAGVVEIVVVEVLLGLHWRGDVAKLYLEIVDPVFIDKDNNVIPIRPELRTFYIKKNYGSQAGLVVTRNEFMVYPNPIQKSFTIAKSDAKPISYQVYNALGALIHSGTHAQYTVEISSANWPSGIYYVKMENNAEAIRLIKE